nr:variable surface lipoprotein [Mycoplasmopsis bovis]
MKKSKFLLLGSVASLASIPFSVAPKCGETKEEKKPEPDKSSDPLPSLSRGSPRSLASLGHRETWGNLGKKPWIKHLRR